jgi:hypothetical protein
VHRLGLDWTAHVDKDDRPWQALHGIGPHGQAVIDELLARATELEFCEHHPEDFSFWIATRPGMLLCDFCYQTAQMFAEDISCAACGQWAGSPGTDAIVVARVAAWLGAHFCLCSVCAEQDLRHAEHPI